jgi:hypothetical protein
MPRAEIKWVIYLIGLGGALVTYAHVQFATKTEVREVKETVIQNDKKTNDAIARIDGRVYEIWKEIVK